MRNTTFTWLSKNMWYHIAASWGVSHDLVKKFIMPIKSTTI